MLAQATGEAAPSHVLSQATEQKARSVLRAIPDATALRCGDPRIMRLLVCYASRHASTAGIAARIATRLVDSGASVDLAPG